MNPPRVAGFSILILGIFSCLPVFAVDPPHPLRTILCSPESDAQTTSSSIVISEGDEKPLVKLLESWAQRNGAIFREGHHPRSLAGDEFSHHLIDITTASDVEISVYQEDRRDLAYVMIIGFVPGKPCAVPTWDWKQDWRRVRGYLRQEGYKVN